MPSPSARAAAIAAVAMSLMTTGSSAARLVDDSQCDCYLIDGSAPTYYKSHAFWDFRSLSEYAGVPGKISTVEGNKNADYTSDYFSDPSGSFRSFWGPQKWQSGEDDFPMINSYNNLYIQDSEGTDAESDTFLTMRTYRQPGFQTASEFESLQLTDHASMRMRARTVGSSGACTAMFTYLGAEHLRDVQEADIEMLTRDPSTWIHYTNQPSYLEDGTTVDGASHNVSMPDGRSWRDWTTHRLDWTPGMTVWSADGTETWKQAFQTPVSPSTLIFNAWSNGQSWTGEMPEGGEAEQQIQWIEVLYDLAEESACQSVCSVDESDEVGRAVTL